MAFIAFIAFAFTLTTFIAFIAFIAFAFTLTAFIAFIARRMPFFIGGASSTAFFIAFAMMKGEREIEGYGHELKNQLEPQQKKELSRLSQDPMPKPITRTLHIPPSHMTSYRQIRWAYNAGAAYTRPSSTTTNQLQLNAVR